ncbi:UNVERIFIED_CONTAM: hypothetical protein O8I53_13715 [Campylobacter lari]
MPTNPNKRYDQYGAFRNLFLILAANQNTEQEVRYVFGAHGEKIDRFQNLLTKAINNINSINQQYSSNIVKNLLKNPSDPKVNSSFLLSEDKETVIRNFNLDFNSFKNTVDNSKNGVIQLLKHNVFGVKFKKDTRNDQFFNNIIGENNNSGLGKISKSIETFKNKYNSYAEEKLSKLKQYLTDYLNNADFIDYKENNEDITPTESQKTKIQQMIDVLTVNDN